MLCNKCGAKIEEGAKFCGKCGAPVSMTEKVKSAAGRAFEAAESQLDDAIDDVRDTFTNPHYQNGGFRRLNENRGLVSYILLSIITLGIYSYYFIYKMAQDVNTACEGDGDKTAGLATFIILSIITCGIYSWIWYYKLGNRLEANAYRYNLKFQENGTTVLLWLIFGSLICGIGAFVAMWILIKNCNAICAGYNRKHYIAG